MKTMHLRLLVLLLALLSLFVVACEEDSDDEGTTDGDEDGDTEAIDCTALDEETCDATDQCQAYYAVFLGEEECRSEYTTDRIFATCAKRCTGGENLEINVIAPDGSCWHFGNYCIPEGWINLFETNDETYDDHWCNQCY